jgi:hypothetical protein
MRKNLKQLALLPLFCGLVATIACDKEKDDDTPFNIIAVVENGSDYDALIDKVKYLQEFETDEKNRWGDPIWAEEVMAIGTYANGGFTLTLPATPNAKFLVNPDFGNFETSDRNARITTVADIYAYNSDDVRVGNFSLRKQDENGTVWGAFIYADRNFTITGSEIRYERIEEVHSMALVKGWNRVYVIKTENREEWTTNAVSGLKWYFNSWFEQDYLGASKRSPKFSRFGK